MRLVLTLTWATLVGADDGWKETTNQEGQRVQQMQVMAPTLTEADQKDARLPEMYRCDACMAVAHHLKGRLSKHKVTLQSWEYIDVFEETCKEGEFPGYGVKLINGENALSGPGILRDESLQPGGASIQMGGESWSRRLASECKEIVFDIVGEDEVYKFRKAADFGAALCGKAGYCDQEGVKAAAEGRKAAKKAAKKDAEKKKEEKEKKKAEKKRKEESGEETEEEEEMREKLEAKKKKEKARKEKEAKEREKRVAEAEKKRRLEKEAPKSGAKMTWASYAQSLAARGVADAGFLDAERSAKDWDKMLLKLSGKISAEALEKAEL